MTTNWAKIVTVIRRWNEKERFSLMQSYLPKDSSGTSSGYAECGGRVV